MKLPRGVVVVAVLAVALTAPAACAKTSPGSGGPSPVPSAPAAVPTPTVSPPGVPQPTSPGSTVPSGSATAPGGSVLSARVTYQWHWPNDGAASVTHTYHVPPVPALIRIGAGDHPREQGERPYNRMTFTFTTAMPSYTVLFVDHLVGDGSGQPIPLRGRGVLKVTFRQAQAHTSDGARSTIRSQPPAALGMRRMVDYAGAGDYEGVVTYGIGIDWPIAHSNPQIAVRLYEVVRVDGNGRRQYVVAVDVDASG